MEGKVLDDEILHTVKRFRIESILNRFVEHTQGRVKNDRGWGERAGVEFRVDI